MLASVDKWKPLLQKRNGTVAFFRVLYSHSLAEFTMFALQREEVGRGKPDE